MLNCLIGKLKIYALEQDSIERMNAIAGEHNLRYLRHSICLEMFN